LGGCRNHVVFTRVAAVPRELKWKGLRLRIPLRGIKDSPPYLHDDRLLTLDDTVEFFNLVLGVNLNTQEKKDLVAFIRAL